MPARRSPRPLRFVPAAVALLVAGVLGTSASCKSKSSSAPAACAAGTTTGGATCASPGGPLAGPADTHCVGVPVQVTSETVCDCTALAGSGGNCTTSATTGAGGAGGAGGKSATGGAGGAGGKGTGGTTAATGGAGGVGGASAQPGSTYGPTHDGDVADDDDCKYHVSWTSTPICENEGVTFTVTATYLTNGTPLTGANTLAEVYLNSTHPAPNSGQMTSECSPGVYTVGPILFDEEGVWTVRFHFNEQCSDLAPSSPHGHAAFYVKVP
jgi:hypothetical protein